MLVLCGVYIGLLIVRRYLVALDNHVSGDPRRGGAEVAGGVFVPGDVAGAVRAVRGDRVAYLVPLLMLTFADAAAAVVGRRYGTLRYPTPGGCKSLEGSLAFAMVTFAATHLSLLLMSDAARWESVLVAVVIALVLTLMEAFATGGWDNFLVPVGGVADAQVAGGDGRTATGGDGGDRRRGGDGVDRGVRGGGVAGIGCWPAPNSPACIHAGLNGAAGWADPAGPGIVTLCWGCRVRQTWRCP